MSTVDAFREEVRTWLDEHCPASMRTPTPPGEYIGGGRRARISNPDSKLWLDRMAQKGWTPSTWPSEYGGGGLGRDENRVLQEELRRINARSPLGGMGLTMIGPALIEYGNEEQKQEHLPKIVRGEIWWCQGYSEPNAGSDLASLQTRAVEDGDDYVINGSKIWTSGADQADWMFCLVRTNPDAPKHEGISFILLDMSTPGVSVKPIRLISGASPFCQTFFDDVRVPKKNVVGEVNQGWTVGKRLLQYERASIGGATGAAGQQSEQLEDVAKRYLGTTDGRLNDALLRDRIAHHRMNDRIYGLTTRRSLEESKSGRAAGFLSSLFKYYGTEQNKAKFELLLRVMGSQSFGWEGEGFADEELATTRGWLRSKA
ncbi:MAG: acyl-CoA dehydrogenase family protein, partial [Pseudomonadales bacterium]